MFYLEGFRCFGVCCTIAWYSKLQVSPFLARSWDLDDNLGMPWTPPPALSELSVSWNVYHLQYWLGYQEGRISISLSWIVIQHKLDAASLLLGIFSLHITKFSIKFQQCAFSWQKPQHLSSQSREFRPCLPHMFPRYPPANLFTFRVWNRFQIWPLSVSLCLSRSLHS